MAIAQYKDMATSAANSAGVPVGLFLGLVQQESSWNAHAVSPVGAYGLAQLMPGTANELGVNPYDPQSNLNGGARYLRQMYDKFGNWKDALGAYNAGPNGWGKVLAGTRNAPAETTNYIQRVTSFATDKFGWNGSNAQSAGNGATLPTIGPTGGPSLSGQTSGQNNGYQTNVIGEGGQVIGGYDQPNGGPLRIGIFGSTPVSDIVSNIVSKVSGAAGGKNSTDKTSPSTASDNPGALGNAPINAGIDNQLAKLFDPDFWRTGIVDILVVLAIIALVLFGVYRVVKPSK